MAVFSAEARPKVNLSLKVIGRRPDGYHALESLVAFARTPSDRVTLDTNGPPGLTVTINGTIEWSPTEAEGPNTYTVKIRVTELESGCHVKIA